MLATKISVTVLVFATLFASVMCTHYMFGVKTDAKLVHRSKVKYEALPLQKRIKYFSYNSTLPIKVKFLMVFFQPLTLLNNILNHISFLGRFLKDFINNFLTSFINVI